MGLKLKSIQLYLNPYLKKPSKRCDLCTHRRNYGYQVTLVIALVIARAGAK